MVGGGLFLVTTTAEIKTAGWKSWRPRAELTATHLNSWCQLVHLTVARLHFLLDTTFQQPSAQAVGLPHSSGSYLSESSFQFSSFTPLSLLGLNSTELWDSEWSWNFIFLPINLPVNLKAGLLGSWCYSLWKSDWWWAL